MPKAIRNAAYLLVALTGGCAAGPGEIPVVRHEAPPVQLASAGPVEAEAPRRAEIVVAAMGTPADEAWPKFDLVVNGRTVGTATADTRALVHHVFAVDLDEDAIERITVRYTNDTKRRGDRNLFVPYVRVNGRTFDADGDTVTFARSGRPEVQPGRAAMYYNGDLTFRIIGRS
ncbi:carbohydrate-binding domain-containing protein [Arenibaculum pallidiluteum]|uniref:carbohydrate-binding domain-containing protein n=1 Tax=Arenibaculum pallidiluteum TaxID=2812559 RepID=UPI001A959F99|nr:carbohydrate-binding domain-containing protein [Arenibaculum pallidiluteum]